MRRAIVKERNYPRNVINDVLAYCKENAGNKPYCSYVHTEQDVKVLNPKIVLDYYLEWNGIVGYTSNIISIMDATILP